jgi:hypothetical protein
MLFCLFRHAAAQAVRDLIVRAGERVLVERPTLRTLQRISEKSGRRQRNASSGAARPGGFRSLEPLGSPATLTTTLAWLGRLRWISLAKTLTEALVHRPQKLRSSRDAKTWCPKAT